jgi:Kdo2-lipid IVA lauroyltransferase/acyltransferase
LAVSAPPTFKHRLEFAGLYLVFLLGRVMPRRSFVAVGRAIGHFVHDVLKVRREVARANLAMVFPDKSAEEIASLARESYGQLGGSLLEFCSLPGMNHDDLIACVDFDGMQHIDRIREQGMGAMLVTAHFGSWELFGASFVARGYDTTFFVKRQKNPMVADLQDDIRRRAGIEIATEGAGVAKAVLRALRRGHLVGILPDQDARRHGVFVDFLGRVASTYKGPAFFAYRANVPIIPAYIRRTAEGNHVGMVLDPIYPDTSRPQEEEVFRLTQAYTDQMNRWIRAYPEHYFWVHRRWKTPPPEDMSQLEAYRRDHPVELESAAGGLD